MDDQLIIRLFLERSEQAVDELDRKYGKLCRMISRNILGNEEDAKECVNDAYLAAWNTIPPQKPNPLQSYICKITRNISLNKYRSMSVGKRNHAYDVTLEELSDCLVSRENVEEEILVRELSDELNVFLGTLEEKERAVFIWRYWYCDSIPEIAVKMRMSTNLVRVRLYRTREKLKKYLERKGLGV